MSGGGEVEPAGEHRTASQHRSFVVVEQVIGPLPRRGAASGGVPARGATPTATGTGRRGDHAHLAGSSTPSAPRPTRSPARSRPAAGRSRSPPRLRRRPPSAKPGFTARARSTNNSTAAESAPLRTSSDGTGHRCSAATRRPSREVAITVTVGGAGQDRLDQIGGGVQHVFAVVQHHQQAPARQGLGDAVGHGERRPAASRPTLLATASGTAAGSPTGASSTSHTPSGNSAASSAATCTARRVLPTPPTPVRVTSRCGPHQLGQLLHLVVAPHEAGRSAPAGSPAPRPPSATAGTRPARPSARTWNRCSATGQVPQPVLTQIDQVDARPPTLPWTPPPGSGRHGRRPSPARPGSAPARSSRRRVTRLARGDPHAHRQLQRRCASTAASIAARAEPNAAHTPSPVCLNNQPPAPRTAEREHLVMGRARADRIASGSDSHRRVEPSCR